VGDEADEAYFVSSSFSEVPCKSLPRSPVITRRTRIRLLVSETSARPSLLPEVSLNSRAFFLLHPCPPLSRRCTTASSPVAARLELDAFAFIFEDPVIKSFSRLPRMPFLWLTPSRTLRPICLVQVLRDKEVSFPRRRYSQWRLAPTFVPTLLWISRSSKFV